MREIKFRAWDKNAGEMIYSDKEYDNYFFEFKDGVLRAFVIIETEGTLHEPPGTDCEELSDLMEFIGLKDKNGKEIYEGDIIRFPLGKLYLDEPTILHDYEVKWEQETCSWILSGYGGRLVTHREYEIIGNIYENPELLND